MKYSSRNSNKEFFVQFHQRIIPQCNILRAIPTTNYSTIKYSSYNFNNELFHNEIFFAQFQQRIIPRCNILRAIPLTKYSTMTIVRMIQSFKHSTMRYFSCKAVNETFRGAISSVQNHDANVDNAMPLSRYSAVQYINSATLQMKYSVHNNHGEDTFRGTMLPLLYGTTPLTKYFVIQYP